MLQGGACGRGAIISVSKGSSRYATKTKLLFGVSFILVLLALAQEAA